MSGSFHCSVIKQHTNQCKWRQTFKLLLLTHTHFLLNGCWITSTAQLREVSKEMSSKLPDCLLICCLLLLLDSLLFLLHQSTETKIQNFTSHDVDVVTLLQLLVGISNVFFWYFCFRRLSHQHQLLWCHGLTCFFLAVSYNSLSILNLIINDLKHLLSYLLHSLVFCSDEVLIQHTN